MILCPTPSIFHFSVIAFQTLNILTPIFGPLVDKVRHFVDTAGFVTVIDGCNMETTLEYLADRHSAEIDWDALSMDSAFLQYDFRTGSRFGRRWPG